MQQKSLVERADILSRKRAQVVAAAAVMFLVAQVLSHPLAGPTEGLRAHMWALNAVLLLFVLATGGALLRGREVRALMNDELTQAHYRTCILAGFWVAMVTAMGIYFLPAAQALPSRVAVYFIVTASIVASLLTFSWLELRAHRDA